MDGENKFETVNIEYFQQSSNPVISVVVPTIPSSQHDRVKTKILNQKFELEYEAFAVNDESIDLCEARNAGLAYSSSDVVAYTDDDCIPNLHWLKQMYSSFSQEVVCIEGAVRGGINYGGNRRYVGCNLAVDRDEAIKVGGFRSAFDGWRDDTEFGWRMEKMSDGKCVFNPEAVVTHPTRPRSTLIEDNERKLKKEYPDRYNEIMNDSVLRITYRKMQNWGIIGLINRIRYVDQ